MTEPIVLASMSGARRALLAGAGVPHRAVSPGVDEEAAKAAFRAEGAAPRDQADWLAELKAVRASQKHRGFVIGADQMLTCEGAAFDKAQSLSEARERLAYLRGREHQLLCAVVIAKEGAVLWRTLETARLTMRPFSDAFLDTYLAEHGEAALSSVGCYQLEGGGAQLFSRIEGDYFAILGLPLLPVLGQLRTLGALPG